MLGARAHVAGLGCARWTLVLVSLTFILVVAPALAQDDLPLDEMSDSLGVRPDELRAYWALHPPPFGSDDVPRPIRAKEMATRILAERDDSFMAHLVLGDVQQNWEADFPRAAFHLRQALSIFEARYSNDPGSDAPWRWHSGILLSLAFVHGDLELYQQQLDLFARYNEKYEPKVIAEQVWPLMKQRRFDLARVAAREGIESGRVRQLEVALNGLCAIEFEAGNDLVSYEACREAMENARRKGRDLDTADLMNFAEASRSLFKLDEAERIDREATASRTSWYGNPWSELAELYTREGRLAEALSSLKEVPRYRAARPPRVRESDRNENRRALASFLVVMGRGEAAMRITSEALVKPDRRGHSSRDPAQDRAISALLDRRARRLHAEQLQEGAAGAGVLERLWAWCEASWLRVQGWLGGRRALRVLAGGDKLSETFRIGTAGSAVMPPWLVGELTQLTGAGVVATAIEAARERDERPGSEAYYDAFAGEVALGDGALEEAVLLLGKAGDSLPPAEQLLRARTLALLADAHAGLGDVAACMEATERAMQIDPGVFRRLEVPVPVRVESLVGGLAEDVADALFETPRFVEDDAGFLVLIEADRMRGKVCLQTSGGVGLGCAEATIQGEQEGDALVQDLLAGFHDEVFEPRVDLSQADVHSLDGSTVTARGSDLEDLLEVGAGGRSRGR